MLHIHMLTIVICTSKIPIIVELYRVLIKCMTNGYLTNLGIAFTGYLSVFPVLFVFSFSNSPTKSIPSVRGRK